MTNHYSWNIIIRTIIAVWEHILLCVHIVRAYTFSKLASTVNIQSASDRKSGYWRYYRGGATQVVRSQMWLEDHSNVPQKVSIFRLYKTDNPDFYCFFNIYIVLQLQLEIEVGDRTLLMPLNRCFFSASFKGNIWLLTTWVAPPWVLCVW